jgi:hypothetical protein
LSEFIDGWHWKIAFIYFFEIKKNEDNKDKKVFGSK